jgi:glycerol uptake facilitator-like aquaporin
MTAQAIVAEFIGTLFFLSIILNVVHDSSVGVIAIAVGLLAAIYLAGGVSGGHFNPAVSIMMFAKGVLPADMTILYIIAQVIGALSAILLNNFFLAV